MTTRANIASSGLTVRLPQALRSQLDAVARAEHRSAAAYIELLVERDLRERDEQARIVRVFSAAGLPDLPEGEIVRGDGETDAEYRDRAALLGFLTGVQVAYD